MGFSICCNYGIKKDGFSSEYEVMILGGHIKDNDGYTDKLKNYVKIFIIRENDDNNNYFWTIKDKNYTEEENDDNFLLQAEKNIYEYREKISNLEVDTRTKELENEKMKKEINEYKKNFYQKHGFIDDQSQSLEDQIKEQEMQKDKMKENLEIDKEITDLKIKLKYIMEKKTEKTCDFFNETSGIFMNYYDAVCKIINVDKEGELSDFFSNSSLDEMKVKYTEQLNNLKTKLEEFNTREDQIVTELHRYPQYEKSLSDAFKNEIINYRIIDDTQY
jgi:predicted GNAT family N-acyltransferase